MFSAGSWAKIWDIKEIKEKYSEVRISTSVKNKNTNEYEQDFGGYVRMVGQAHQQLQYLSNGDRFKIVRCGVTNKYDKEKKQTYTNYVVFEMDAEDPAEPRSDFHAPSNTEDNPFLSE